MKPPRGSLARQKLLNPGRRSTSTSPSSAGDDSIKANCYYVFLEKKISATAKRESEVETCGIVSTPGNSGHTRGVYS